MASGTSWYDEAEAYDLAFSFPPEREIAFLLALLERDGVRPPARLLEPMVGSGRMLPPLERAGFALTGLDLSAPMLRLARRKSPAALLFRADARRFRLAPRHDAAFCLIDSFRYLLDLADARRFFDAVAAALRPGAPFLLGLELHAGDGPPPESWTTRRGELEATATIRSGGAAGPDLEWMDAEVVVSGPAGTCTVRSRLPQRRWTPAAFCAFLDACERFEVRGLYRRDHDLSRPLAELPRSGGPVIAHLGLIG